MKMLEIISVVLVLGIFATIVTPRLSKMIDSAMLDRETKRLGSEISLLQSMSRVQSYDDSVFANNIKSPELKLLIQKNYYGIVKDNIYINGVHNLPNNFEITPNPITLNFNPSSNVLTGFNGTMTITSRHGNVKYIIVDSVGRWRIDLTPR